MIKGIGPVFAQKIVQQFGAETLNVIEAETEKLIEVPGIGGKRIEMIRAAWQEQKEIKNVMLFLQDHDVSSAHAVKIYKAYGKDSIEIVKTNPYRLADVRIAIISVAIVKRPVDKVQWAYDSPRSSWGNYSASSRCA